MLNKRLVSFVFFASQFLLLAIFLSSVSFAQNTASGGLSSLFDHKHGLIMRHARAPGIGDPEGFNIEDCKTQRNLSDEGRSQAQEIGQWLKQQGLKEAAVFSSPWCRARDTAKLLDIGEVHTANELASTFRNQLQFPNKALDLKGFIVDYLSSNQSLPLVLVSHEVNISALLGVETSSGEMVIFELTHNGQLRSVNTFSAIDK